MSNNNNIKSADEEIEDERNYQLVDKVIFTEILNNFHLLLKEKAIDVNSRVTGPSSIALSRKIITEKFPDLNTNDIANTFRFVVTFYYFQQTHASEDFICIFKDTDKDRVLELVDITKKNKNSLFIKFRAHRVSNYLWPILDLKIQERFLLGEEDDTIKINYYDIVIPYMDQEGKPGHLRLEIDRYELEVLVSSLARVLEE